MRLPRPPRPAPASPRAAPGPHHRRPRPPRPAPCAPGPPAAGAGGEWFPRRSQLADAITLTVFKVPGETNTDDFSPASEAWSRPDIPLHAKAMLVSKMPEGLATIDKLKAEGRPIAFVGDVVGTGSSRKSAINSVLWHLGEDIPYVPNKRQGGVILGGKIAPIFFNTAEDSGALPIEFAVSKLNTGDVTTI